MSTLLPGLDDWLELEELELELLLELEEDEDDDEEEEDEDELELLLELEDEEDELLDEDGMPMLSEGWPGMGLSWASCCSPMPSLWLEEELLEEELELEEEEED